MHCSVFSPRIIQGMTGGRGLGVACGHIKAFGLFPSPHQRKICSEGLQGRHALSMLGRTLTAKPAYASVLLWSWCCGHVQKEEVAMQITGWNLAHWSVQDSLWHLSTSSPTYHTLGKRGALDLH